MKRIIITLIVGAGILFGVPACYAKEFREHVSKEFTVSAVTSQETLAVYNIFGFIKVEGYAGNKIVLEMDKTISADTDKDLEAGKREFKLGFEQKSDTVMAYIAEPYDSRPRRGWQRNENHREVEYNCKVDFTVKVPYGTNLNISTVNDGAIVVENVSGSLKINNVNAGITVKNAKGTTQAHTVNGDISVNYLTNPKEASSYKTINGEIRITYQPGFSADLTFKSMHGDFFTDFSDAKLLPVAATKIEKKNGHDSVFKLEKTTTVRFGKGGSVFKFETLNGDVYIKKQS